MGRNAFEDDPDVLAMRASMQPTQGSMRWGRVLTGLLVVGCATFAFAYYLPLQRAHTTLNQRFGELQTQVDTANRGIADAKKEAKEAEEQRRSLESQADANKQSEKARGEQTQTLKSTLEGKLQKALAKDQAAVGTTSTQAVASLALSQLMTPNKLEVSQPGKALLCGLASAGAERPLRVVVLAEKKSIPPALAAKLKSPLAYSVAVAQVVTEALADKCNVPAARLSATGLPAEPARPAKVDGKKLSGPRVELWFD